MVIDAAVDAAHHERTYRIKRARVSFGEERQPTHPSTASCCSADDGVDFSALEMLAMVAVEQAQHERREADAAAETVVVKPVADTAEEATPPMEEEADEPTLCADTHARGVGVEEPCSAGALDVSTSEGLRSSSSEPTANTVARRRNSVGEKENARSTLKATRRHSAAAWTGHGKSAPLGLLQPIGASTAPLHDAKHTVHSVQVPQAVLSVFRA